MTDSPEKPDTGEAESRNRPAPDAHTNDNAGEAEFRRAGTTPGQTEPATQGAESAPSPSNTDATTTDAAGDRGVADERTASPQTEASARDADADSPAGDADFNPLPTLPEFDTGDETAMDASRVSMLSDVDLRVKIELGRMQMLVEDVLKLGEGSVVELDKLAGDPVDVYVNERLVARGEVLVLNDNFCVRISEVLANDPHRIAT